MGDLQTFGDTDETGFNLQKQIFSLTQIKQWLIFQILCKPTTMSMLYCDKGP